MSGRSDVENGLRQRGADDLRAVVEDEAAGQERVRALKALLRRRPEAIEPELGALVADAATPAELRTTAAVALGRHATPANEAALVRALASDDPSVVAATGKALARVGGQAAYEALRDTEPRGAPARVLSFARTLLSYRLGRGTDRLAEPPASALLELDPERARPVAFRAVEPEEFAADRRWLDRELPAIDVEPRGSLRFRCGAEHLWLVLAAGATGSAGDRVAAVVLRESDCPDGWYVHEYVVTHPRPGRPAALFGLRSTGKLMHAGELDADSGAVQLRAVDAPGVAALELRGTLGADGTLVVSEARYGPPRDGGRSRPAAPAPAERSPGTSRTELSGGSRPPG